MTSFNQQGVFPNLLPIPSSQARNTRQETGTPLAFLTCTHRLENFSSIYTPIDTQTTPQNHAPVCTLHVHVYSSSTHPSFTTSTSGQHSHTLSAHLTLATNPPGDLSEVDGAQRFLEMRLDVFPQPVRLVRSRCRITEARSRQLCTLVCVSHDRIVSMAVWDQDPSKVFSNISRHRNTITICTTANDTRGFLFSRQIFQRTFFLCDRFDVLRKVQSCLYKNNTHFQDPSLFRQRNTARQSLRGPVERIFVLTKCFSSRRFLQAKWNTPRRTLR